MKIKRIIAAILTFGLSERMGSKPTNGVTMTDGNELRRAIGEGKVTFTELWVIAWRKTLKTSKKG